MIEAVKRFGIFKGFYLGIKRLGRCQPMCEGGFDPVPELTEAKKKNTPANHNE
jgi:hypothetical protein